MQLQSKGNIHTELGKKYGLHRPVVKAICDSPFIFAARTIEDEDNKCPIMFAYLFKLKLKKYYKKKTNDEN